jgi:methyl-accepting chemotaxis protein
MTDHGPLKIFNLDKIAACAKDLNALGPDTETEFLSIGKTLNTLASICYGMTDNAFKLSSLANFSSDGSEDRQDSFVEENSKVFEAVTAHVKETLSSLSSGDSLLSELLTQMHKLRELIRGLQSIGKTFRVLGMAIKVESSRGRDSLKGFILLAEEVADIARLVHDNCMYCIDKADLVEKDISVSHQVLKESESSYDDGGERAIQNILRSLEDIGRRSDQPAADIQERSSAMVQGISDVVMAMQFHDITRQQLENVAAALTETIEKAKSVQSLDTDEAIDLVIIEIYSILSIQIAHLNSIYEQVRNARKQIATGLGQTMEQARIQATDARALLELEGRQGNRSVVADLESEIDNIVISLNSSLKVVKHAAEVSRAVYDNVLQIGSFVNKIEGIALDVKVLAINAMVEALKTDTAGNTLSVLAKELSNLSQETRNGASDSIEMLQRIMEGTEKQLEFSVNLDESSTVVDEMIDKAKQFTGTILSSLQEVGSIGHEMDHSSQDLSSRITRLIPGIKFTQVLGDRIDRNWQILCRTIDQIEETYPQLLERSSEAKQIHEKLAQQYVMERERAIHAQVAGGVAASGDSGGDIDLFDDDGIELFEDDAAPGMGVAGESAQDDEFGDNVELF